MTRTGTAILETDGLTKAFGSVRAVDELSVSFRDDELCAVIGPNGAGKTTFLNLLSGTLEPTSGEIVFAGEDITALPAHEIANRGVVRSFQITELFDELTVLENVRLALQHRINSYVFWTDAARNTDLVEDAHAILERVGLDERADRVASTLSHGEERTLELAVTLGADPEILLLDEPTSGMSPEETREVIDIVEEIAADLPILLVEHKMSVVRRVSDRIVVLHNGRKIADGAPSEVREDEQVKRVYLGGERL